ncbi:L-asparaginase [Microscilla marina ATCC 23134]|uniref:L-asparaginase n=2 Tax=Microscilla marina TaxID=1027 RepID=A1ZW46_MICM2|nr:L-asparaginase [Microscilla marina ATCC 23134]
MHFKTFNFMKKQVFILVVLLVAPLMLQAQKNNDADLKQIRQILDNQSKAWNKGDLVGFMQGYWKSKKLQFVGSKGVKYGWKATLEGYQKGYPSKEKMGILKFTILSVEKISDDAAFVIGKWHLTRKNDTPNGHFSLLWRKIKGQWLIVADHSS